jgi:peptidoglycan LD-endopeptidase LytH
VFFGVLILILAAGGWFASRLLWGSPTRYDLRAWFTDPVVRAKLITNLSAPCPGSPFLLPSAGFVGFLYADPSLPYSPVNGHTGIDIFGDGDLGTVPIYAAYDGYLTRLTSWKSAVIIRVPKDPLDPSRQIWLYVTHMANASGDESYINKDFPPGTSEKFVKQGTFLGYQGMYDGLTPPRIRMHVHVSVVTSDPSGSFRNETQIRNTLDPSPYFGMTLNATRNPTIPVKCGA